MSPFRSGQPLRIAFFSDSAPPLVNGVATSVCLLAEALRHQGHEVTLFSPRSLPATLAWPPVRDLRVAAPLLPLDSGEEFDIVHAHTPFGAGVAGARLARRQGVPLVATFHTAYGRVGASYRPFRSLLAFLCLRLWARRFYNRCDRVVAPSDAARGWLRELGVRAPVVRIPTAIPLSPPSANGHSLLCVSRLADEKNVGLVVEAFKAANVKGVRLVLVGDGPLRFDLEQLASGNVQIEFIGELAGEALARAYGEAKAVILASVCETQGLVVMEAAARGKPAIVCEGGGPAEFVTDGITGLVVKPEVGELRDAIRRLFSSECTAEWGMAARERIAAWTPDDMAQAVVNTYLGAIRQKQQLHPNSHERKLQT